MSMSKRDCELSIAIPASLATDIPHLREKTLKIGMIGRAASIFCTDEVIVFPDRPRINQINDARQIVTILSYLETPQYLRKQLFKITPILRYAGILPPLRTPHHQLSNKIKELKLGDYREGVILAITKTGGLADIGVERPVLIPDRKLPINTRVTVKVIKLGKQPRVSLVNRERINAYWGYRVWVSRVPFGQLVENRSFDLVIATSRHGKPIMAVADKLVKHWKKSRKILVAFGAPTRGLYEIVAQEGKKLTDVAQYIVNSIPDQGTKTVRTEEALFITLAMLNGYSSFHR